MFNFTQEERRVFLFLAVIGLSGLGINFAVKKFAKVESVAYLSRDLGKVNLNTADKSTLMCVSGIGERLAARIIEYREKSGGFVSLEELRKIKGINGSRFFKIKEYLIAE